MTSGAVKAASERAVLLTDTRRNRVAVGLVVLSLFAERWEKDLYLSGRVAVPNVVFTAVALGFVAYVLAVCGRRALMPRPVGVLETALFALVGVLGLLSALALVFGPAGLSGSQSAKTYVHVLFLAGMAVVLGRSLSRELVSWALRAFFVLTAILCALAILQALDLNVLHTNTSHRLHLLGRRYATACGGTGYVAPVSIFSEPALLGYFSTSAILVAVFLCRRSRRVVVGAVICAAALVLSASAGAVAVAAVLAAVLVSRYARGVGSPRTRLLVLGAVALVAAGVAFSTPGEVLWRRGSAIWHGSDASAAYRGAVGRAAVDIWHRSPVVGVGLGNSRQYLPSLLHVWFLPHFVPQFADASAYFDLLGETGPLGVVALVLLLGTLYRRRGPPDRLSALTQTFVLQLALECLIITAFLQPFFWLMVGLRLAAARLPREAHATAPVSSTASAGYWGAWLGAACAAGAASTLLFLHVAPGTSGRAGPTLEAALGCGGSGAPASARVAAAR